MQVRIQRVLDLNFFIHTGILDISIFDERCKFVFSKMGHYGSLLAIMLHLKVAVHLRYQT